MWITGKDCFESKLFKVAGADKVFYPAKAWIERSKVYVKSEQVPHPVAVRYAFDNYVDGDLYGCNGLPISSFRTDNW
jgi:sialate O-acetylesterase